MSFKESGQPGAETRNALLTRRSVRSFLPDQVDPAVIRSILKVAARAPSGSNIQPWQVHVVTGKTRDTLSNALLDAFHAGEPMRADYQYYPPQWRDPYLSRRRNNGWALYELLGVQRGDKASSQREHARNFTFFGAPAVVYVTIDHDMGQGSWLDVGMFLQAFMIAARSFGLHTCPQVAVIGYPDIVRNILSISPDKILICGVSIGYEDPEHPANQLRTDRTCVDDFTTFHG